MSQSFHVGLTPDFLNSDGDLAFGDIGLDLLDQSPLISREFICENVDELTPELISDFDAILVLSPRVGPATLATNSRLKLVARFGVGYDNVDVDACTKNGVLLTITPAGVRRPVAASVMTLLLALSHKLVIKDRLTRAGRWSERIHHMGVGVTGKTLGVIGFGNIGREVFKLAQPFGMRHIASDPVVSVKDAATQGVELVSIERLLQEADYICITCALTRETHHLIDAESFDLMKKSAFLINVARGPIVDQKALTDALTENRIAGAGIDVFEQEPVDPNEPLLKLENVIVAPHAICWTDECFLGNGQTACQSIIDVASGKIPQHVVNLEVLKHENWKSHS